MPEQLLHLVFGGELTAPHSMEFKDLAKLDLVGIYPNFAEALKNGKVPLRVHHGLYQNETAELCQWHVNQAHELEAWGDARAFDGTVSILQPLIEPLYGGKTATYVEPGAGERLTDAPQQILNREGEREYITAPAMRTRHRRQKKAEG